LGAFVEAHRLGVVLTCDTAFVLHRDPDTVRAPDVAFVERERYASFGDDTGALPGAPDLAIEVLSPSDAYSDVHAKVADYLAAGARQVWVVDPARSTITRYAELLAPRTFSEGETLTAPALLPGFELRVAEVFTR
jgi:Uma2 family endonuclease